MTIKELIEIGYVKLGEVDGMVLYTNFNSTSPKKTSNDFGFIFQFNLDLQEKAIGQILITKDILERLVESIK